jgi:hypothetical protein
MFRPPLIISTFFTLLLAAHGPGCALGQSPQQVQQREAQEQQRRVQRLAEQQRDIEERIARRQRDEQRETEESMERQRRARSLAEEQHEAQEQTALLVQRRAQAEAERQRKIQLEQQAQIPQPADTPQSESPDQVPRSVSRAQPEPALSPRLLALTGICLLAGTSLFMLGKIIRHRYTHR